MFGGAGDDGGMGGVGSTSGGMDTKKLGAGLRGFGEQTGLEGPRMGGMSMAGMAPMQMQSPQQQSSAMPGGVLSMADIMRRGSKYNRRLQGGEP